MSYTWICFPYLFFTLLSAFLFSCNQNQALPLLMEADNYTQQTEQLYDDTPIIDIEAFRTSVAAADPSTLNDKDSFGRTGLHLAADYGAISAVHKTDPPLSCQSRLF